jgi:hypothetical protein
MGKIKGRKTFISGNIRSQGTEFQFFPFQTGPLITKNQSPVASPPCKAPGCLGGAQGKALAVLAPAASSSYDKAAVGHSSFKGVKKFGVFPDFPRVNRPCKDHLPVQTAFFRFSRGPFEAGNTEPPEPHILHGPAYGAYITRLLRSGKYDANIFKQHIQY